MSSGLAKYTGGSGNLGGTYHGLTWLNFMHDRIKNDVKHDPKDITHHAVCLIRNNRVHRSALYNGIKHLKDKILIKYRGDYLVS